jgi:hypothetical protein
MRRSHFLIGFTAAACLFGASAAQAQPTGVKVGVLTCNVSSGWGLVFGSSKDLDCSFSPTADRSDKYVGKINKYGVDIGYQKGGVMAWAVFAPGQVSPGGLAGNYGGVTAGGSAGVGANANALIGGSDNTISLQPLSIEGVVGLNIAAGVASISLNYAP